MMHAMAAPPSGSLPSVPGGAGPIVLRQSIKLLIAAYAACGLLEILIVVYWFAAPGPANIPVWVPLLVPLGLQMLAAIRHLERLMSRLTVADDRVKFESGMFSKSTRVMELVKIQDVRVDQTLVQRMLNVGNLSLETAGETSRIVMPAIDRPHEAADHVLVSASGATIAAPPAPRRPWRKTETLYPGA
jgi:membrane protein YdbS with pleckstrin-like domain